jgi:hypothetical protein
VEKPMSAGDALLWFYVTFATVAFTCMIVFFAIRGAQQHLRNAKLGRDITADDEALRALLRQS